MRICPHQLVPFLVVFLTFLVDSVQSQSIIERKSLAVQGGLSAGFDVGAAGKKSYLNPSLTYYELKSITKNNTILIGWTARLSAFYGNDLNYYTAPARLTRVDNVDTVSFGRLSQTSLNVGIRAEWNLGRIQFGASVDLLGFTFLGRSRIGRVYSSTGLFIQTDSLGQDRQRPFQGSDVFQEATPTRFNVKLSGDHDRGMSTTEVYTRVYLVPSIALKLGYQLLTTEMALSNRDLVADNARFRNRSGLFYVAITLPIMPW